MGHKRRRGTCTGVCYTRAAAGGFGTLAPQCYSSPVWSNARGLPSKGIIHPPRANTWNRGHQHFRAPVHLYHSVSPKIRTTITAGILLWWPCCSAVLVLGCRRHGLLCRVYGRNAHLVGGWPCFSSTRGTFRLAHGAAGGSFGGVPLRQARITPPRT